MTSPIDTIFTPEDVDKSERLIAQYLADAMINLSLARALANVVPGSLQPEATTALNEMATVVAQKLEKVASIQEQHHTDVV